MAQQGPNQSSTRPAADVAAGDVAQTPAAGARKLSLKKRVQIAIAGLMGSAIIRTLALTYRYRILYKDKVFTGRRIPAQLDEARGAAGGPLLFALWHGTCFPIISYWRDRGMRVVTSRSTDGQALGRVLHRLGFHTVSGSSSRGGTRALIDLARSVRSGGDAAIAVDGPRGPAQHVKPGIILLAKLTGRPIIPLVGAAKSYWQFQSWDRFRMPLPFTKAVIMAAEPFHVPADADHDMMELKRMELEGRLQQMQIALDEDIQPRVWKRADRKAGKSTKPSDV